MCSSDLARALAEAMVSIGRHAGVRTEALLTDMSAPLGDAVGNALEIAECIQTLSGRGPAALVDVVCRIASRMVELAGLEADPTAARARVDRALASGAALERLARMIEAHGGDARITEDPSRLPSVSGRAAVTSPRAGYVCALGAEAIGRASHVLGAGREKLGDPVDHAVGVVVRAHPGARVEAGQPIVELHHRDGRGVDEARRLVDRKSTRLNSSH